VLELVLYSNRAQAFLSQAMFFEAKEDAASALAIDSTHAKSKRRLAFALDGLGRHSEALKLMQTYPCPKKDLAQVKVRLQQSGGDYQLPQKEVPDSYFDNFADFTGPVEVRAAGSKGRGLFLTRSVTAGGLLFVERAFAASAHGSRSQNDAPVCLNYGTIIDYGSTPTTAAARVNDASQEEVIGISLRRACSRPIDNERLAFLCGGPREDTVPDMSILKLECEAPSLDVAQCSAHHVRQIVKFNAFGSKCNTTPVSWTGLWVLASFMNHADQQESTVQREFMGPMILCYAKHNLPAGSELTTPYGGAEMSKANWGF